MYIEETILSMAPVLLWTDGKQTLLNIGMCLLIESITIAKPFFEFVVQVDCSGDYMLQYVSKEHAASIHD